MLLRTAEIMVAYVRFAGASISPQRTTPRAFNRERDPSDPSGNRALEERVNPGIRFGPLR